MTNLKNNKPNYRFQGYTDAWKQRKLGEIGHAKSGVGFPENEQGGKKGIPFFKVSDMNTDGNENELIVANNYVTDEQISRRKWRVITEVPAIFFAKVGAAVMLNRKRLIRHPFLLDNNTMTYIFNKSQLDSDFGKILFEKIDLTKLTQVGALPSYNSSDVENINIYIPSLPEQEAIGTFFSTIDQHITLHQRKLDTLKEQKKTYLKLLFPAKGQTKPALRFQGFEDDWEEVKVADIFQVTRGQVLSTNLVCDTKSDEYPYPVYSSQTKNNGLMGFYKDYLFDTAITWTTDGANAGTVRFREGKFYSTNVNGVLLSDVGYSNLAISEILNTVAWKYVSKVGNPKLMNNIMSEIILLIPGGFAEQQVLSSFFQTLDQEITQVEDKLASLKEMKKTLLRKLFVS